MAVTPPITVIHVAEPTPETPPVEVTPEPSPRTEDEIRADERARVTEELRVEREQSEQWQELTTLRSRTSEQETRIQELEGMMTPSTPPVELTPEETPPPGEVTPLDVNEIDAPPQPENPPGDNPERPKRKPGLW